MAKQELRELIKGNHILHDKNCGVTITGDFGNCDCDKEELWQLIEAYAADIEREASKRVGDWATSDDTGTSSKALMRHMLGLGPNRWGFMPPSDASDRGRCIRLLNKFPEWYDRLDEMAQYDGWAKQIELIRKENT